VDKPPLTQSARDARMRQMVLQGLTALEIARALGYASKWGAARRILRLGLTVTPEKNGQD